MRETIARATHLIFSFCTCFDLQVASSLPHNTQHTLDRSHKTYCQITEESNIMSATSSEQGVQASGRGRGERGRGFGGRGRGRSYAARGQPLVCKFYLQNRCGFGNNCRFYHPPSSAIDTNTNYNTNETVGNVLTNTSAVAKKRQFNVHKFNAINISKQAQDAEPRPYKDMEGPFFSMDIECVATGYGHSKKHREPCRVALVKDSGDGEISILLDECVNLSSMKVVSYMTELTGTTKDQCLNPEAKTLQEIRSMVRELLPTNAVLVGHSIEHDIEWLGLEKGADFRDSFCTSILFRQRIPKNLNSAGNSLRRLEEDASENEQHLKNKEHKSDGKKSSDIDVPDDSKMPIPTRYRIFSLRHCCINMLDVDMQEASHDPTLDAKYSLVLFNKYRKSPVPMLRAVRDSLHRAPATASFASTNPVVDGVVLTLIGYKMKASARFIWAWWLQCKSSK